MGRPVASAAARVLAPRTEVAYARPVEVFEYIGVLISVIMGLAITHLGVGATKLIQHRDTARFSLLHALWTVNVLLYILMIWWGLFWWSEFEHWSAFHYLGITSYAIVLFLMSAMLYPYELAHDVDMEAFFFRNRRWFFGLMLAAWLLDIPETLVKQASDLREVPPRYFVFVMAMIVLAIIGLLTSNRAVHRALPVAWLILVGAFISLRPIRLLSAGAAG